MVELGGGCGGDVGELESVGGLWQNARIDLGEIEFREYCEIAEVDQKVDQRENWETSINNADNTSCAP